MRRKQTADVIHKAGLCNSLVAPFVAQLSDQLDAERVEDPHKAEDDDEEPFNALTRKAMLCLHALQRALVLRYTVVDELKHALEKVAPALPTLGDGDALDKSVSYWAKAGFLVPRLLAAYTQLADLARTKHGNTAHGTINSFVAGLLAPNAENKPPNTSIICERLFKIVNKKEQRKYFTDEEVARVDKTHSLLRQGAVRDAIKALKSSLAQAKINGRGFQLHPRETDVSFEVNPQLLDKATPFRRLMEHVWTATNAAATARYTHGGRRRERLMQQAAERLAYYTLPALGEVGTVTRIITRVGERKAVDRYYICVPTPIKAAEPRERPPGAGSRIAANDPGVCTFATVYGSNGKSAQYAPHQPRSSSKRPRRHPRPPPRAATATAASTPATASAAPRASQPRSSKTPRRRPRRRPQQQRPRNGQRISVLMGRWLKIQARLREQRKSDKKLRRKQHKHELADKKERRACKTCQERRKSYHKLRRLGFAAERVMHRVRSLVADLHHRVARDLCRSYNVILQPEFSASQMVRRRNLRTGAARKIPASVVRSLLSWRPYHFKRFLLHKAREFANCVVVIVDEVR